MIRIHTIINLKATRDPRADLEIISTTRTEETNSFLYISYVIFLFSTLTSSDIIQISTLGKYHLKKENENTTVL